MVFIRSSSHNISNAYNNSVGIRLAQRTISVIKVKWFVYFLYGILFVVLFYSSLILNGNTFLTDYVDGHGLHRMDDGKAKSGNNVQLLSESSNGRSSSAMTGLNSHVSKRQSKGTIAYAVSVTGCGSDPITEGAAVLKHSIHRSSVRGENGMGQYDYQMFAIYHPDAARCAEPLQRLGYKLLKRNTPVDVQDIQGEFLRSRISRNGCCGEKELIKLEAYTLTDFPIAVHLDLDVLVLKPLDTLFDWMLHPETVDDKLKQQISMKYTAPTDASPKDNPINAFFTMDYNMVMPQTKYKPVQGGFLVLRPSMSVYNEFKEIIRIGNFVNGKGWGGLVGPFYGSMTFQGIIPYYYNVLHTGQSMELNRCIYNQMADNPRTGKTINDVVHGDCRTGEASCEDCRSRPLADIVTTHYTLCQKPWLCMPHTSDNIQHRLCRVLTKEWFKVRYELDLMWGRSAPSQSKYYPETFYGYCSKAGKEGYSPISEPYQ